MAVDHLDDEAPVRGDHQRCGVPAGDQVADQRLVEIGADVGEIDLPKPPRPIDHRIRAPDAVDQEVEPSRFAADAGDEVRHFLLPRMIDPHGDGPAAGLFDQRGGLVDGLRAVHAPGSTRGAAARAIHQGAGLAQRPRNAAPGAPGGSSHQGDLTGKG